MAKNKAMLIGLAIYTGVILLVASVLVANAAPDQVPAQAIVKKERVSVTIATGAEGSASGSDTTDAVIAGRIVRVDIDYASGLTNTSILTITGVNDLVAQNVILLSATATDQTVYPQVALQDSQANGLTYDGTYTVTDYYPVADVLNVQLGSSEPATPAVTVDIYYIEE